MLLVDTCIFLELLLNQSRAQECREFLDKIARGELEAIVTTFTIHAIEAIINEANTILSFLRNIMASKGLYVYITTISDEIAASILMGKIKRDFDDTLQYYVAKKLGVEAIVSFDKHFCGLDIPRKEPRDYL
ncbi:MAG: PIN domain nuclease [Thermoprotei archaeon]|nr:MAG: PIN domain nuclease [Thermoprotei archaeon]